MHAAIRLPVVFALLGACAILAAAPGDGSAGTYATRVTSGNQIGTTVTNYGLLGNNFISRSPSLEYPLGTGYEHAARAGLWVGAQAVDGNGAFTGVTTACVDGSQGSTPSTLTEFTPLGTSVAVRSRLSNSPFYSPDAISEQDFLSDYDDLTVKTASGVPETHRPLGITVHQQTFAWSFGAFDHVVFYRFAIHNGGAPLSNVWVGMYAELASGSKNAYSCWPPTSGCGPGSWFAKKWIQYDDSLRLFREHYCAASPAPASCNLAAVPAWMGLQVLTPPNASAGQKITVAAWPWSPGDASRDQDAERYALMSAGTVQDLTTPDLLPGTGDPAELVAFGPIASLATGDSVVIDFALVGGSDVPDVQSHARSAQAAHDAGYENLLSLVGVAPAPATTAFALAGAWPNPAAQHVSFAFRLADASPATLELIDIAGRRVWGEAVGSLGAGRHVVSANTVAFAPGAYVLRLAQGERVATAKVAVVR